MKKLSRVTNVISCLVLSAALLVSLAGPALAATPPSGQPASGPQAKPAVEPGSKDAKTMTPLGSTKLTKTDKAGAPQLGIQAGYVAGVDFQSHLKYCWKNLVYARVANTTTTTKYLQIRLYNQSSYRDLYTSVAAGSVAYPAFYGVEGAYTAYLYVWNGSSYQYDEYLSDTNTCNVSVTRVYNSGGWVQLKIQNLGTASATQVSSELAPYPGAGTYTGTQYDYPVPGGAAIYRWFQVGTLPYGILSYTYGSTNTPVTFIGDL